MNIEKILQNEDLLVNDNELLYSLLDDEKLNQIKKKLPSFYKYGKSQDCTAYMSWTFNFSCGVDEEFDIMSNAYYECTLELINKCISDNKDKKLDTWIFPILYNASHSIELKLKSIYLYINNCLEQSNLNHKWTNLIENLKKYYKEQNKKNSQIQKKINNQFILVLEITEKFIKNFLSETDNISFPRYPIDCKNEDFFYNKSDENVVVDLILLRNEYILCYYLLNYIVEMNIEEKSNVD